MIENLQNMLYQGEHRLSEGAWNLHAWNLDNKKCSEALKLSSE